VKRSIVKLGEICEINPRTNYDFGPEDACSFVPMEAVDDIGGRIGRITTRPFREVAKGYTPFAENDVIVAKITPCMENGKCAIGRRLRRGVAFGSTEFHVLRATKRVVPEWLFYFWRFPPTRRLAAVNMTGSAGQKRVPASFLETADIPLPEISEQQRIVGRLEQADRLRRTRRYALELTVAFLPAAFREFFGDARGNAKKWDSVTLGEVLIRGPQNGLYKPASAYGAGTPIIRIDAFYDGAITALDSLKRVRLLPDDIERFGLSENDIVVNRVNSRPYLGKSALIPRLNEPIVFESNMMRLTLNTKSATPVYVTHYLQTSFVKSQIQVLAKDAVNQSSINQEDLKGLIVRLPPLPLQHRFATLVERVERLRGVQREALRQAEHLFASLLDRAFSG
jgi:type I restriction enzyme S subunit